MTKAKTKTKDQPSLLDVEPMKDVTPKKKTETKPKPQSVAVPAPAPVKAAPRKKASQAVAVAAAPLPERQNIMAIIAEVAAKPDFNPENMRQLLDMQKEIMAEQDRRDFQAAFVALQAELPVIRADSRIEVRKKDSHGERTGPIQQSTPYATFNAIMEAIQPLLTKYGFSLSFTTRPSSDGNRLDVIGILGHGGHERTTIFPLPAETSGSKNNVQGWGSTLSFGKRYATIALLNIRSAAPEDRDTDGYSIPNLKRGKDEKFVQVAEDDLVSREQADKLIETIEWCGVPKTTFLQHYGIATVESLPARLYGNAIKSCQDYHDKRANRGEQK